MDMGHKTYAGLVIDLDERESQTVVEAAAQGRAAIEIRPKSTVEREPIGGRLLESRADSLFLSVAEWSEAALPRSIYCDVGLLLNGQQYLFSTSVLDVLDSMEGRRLEVTRPRVLQVLQRRRFVRADLAESAAVRVGPADAGRAPLCKGVLLNISCDGLACRMDCGDAKRFALNDVVRLSFSLRGGTEHFHGIAAVKNLTEGGTEGTVILGLQFDKSPAWAEQAARLRESLGLCPQAVI
jgi:c-di-GMP-binding flagellar brake protein YcgR